VTYTSPLDNLTTTYNLTTKSNKDQNAVNNCIKVPSSSCQRWPCALRSSEQHANDYVGLARYELTSVQ